MTNEVHHLGSTRGDVVWTYALLGGGGALLLGLAPVLADWLAVVPLVPFGGVLEWVGGLDDPWTWVVRPLVGLVVGVVAAAVVLGDEYRLEVGDDALVIVHGDDRRRVERSAVVGVHRDGKRVVVDGDGGRRVFSEDVEASRARVREAFTSHGWPYESE